MKSIELFAGIGGISLAAEWAGIEADAFCEIDSFAQKVLRKQWPQVPIFTDIHNLNADSLTKRGVDIGTIELISGGFPCQPYSIAGERGGKEDDRDLWPEMFRIIQEIRPNWGVDGMLKRSLDEKHKLELIYMANEGKFSQRVIRVVSIKRESVLAYCYTRKNVRSFKKENVLSIHPCKERTGSING